MQKDLEESNNSFVTEKLESETYELILPKLMHISKKIYDENWVSIE